MKRMFLAVFFLWACSDSDAGSDAGSLTDNGLLTDGASVIIDFETPTPVAASTRWILVGNTAQTFDGSKVVYGQGFINLIDRQTRKVVRKINTTQRNPVHIGVHDDVAYIVNSGVTEFDENFLGNVKEGGGIDVLDLSGDLPDKMTDNIPLGTSTKDARIGAYGTMFLDSTGTIAFVGSGTRGDVFKVDLKNRSVLRGADDPIVIFETPEMTNGWTLLRLCGESLAVLNFNTDELCITDDFEGDLATRNCSEIGVNKDMLEGPVDIVCPSDGVALVLMSVANSVYRLDLDEEPFGIENVFAQTGLANNRILIGGEYAYVVNSMDNNLQRIQISSRKSDLPFAVLPVKSNPYDMVITQEVEGEVAWVTLMVANQVALVSLSSGAIIQLVGSTTVAQDAGVIEDAGWDAGLEIDGGAPIDAGVSVD
ncbi:MAG: hypothetical protein V1754_12895 [Pseudomonadota bacterium]